MTATYRGRLAPSPTGTLHLGLARTALCAWLRARSAHGKLIMRIEDIDTPRVVPGSADAIMNDLRWLGLDWDEGPDLGGPHVPYLQSERLTLYADAIAYLEAQGLVYPCTCSRKGIAKLASAPHDDLGPRYPGTCRNGPSTRGRPSALRFRMPEPAPAFRDLLQGDYHAAFSDDFVLRRSDGMVAYQLAVVVDDIAMEISEVVRGADLMSSTPRQIALYRALGAEPPQFLHVPLLLDVDGKRLSKRDGAEAIASYRAAGLQPTAIVGALAHSLGLAASGEQISARALLTRFDPRRLPLTAASIAIASVTSDAT
jgi:glutamyl-tRNA synthetase